MINGQLVSGDISKYSRFRLLEIRELRSSGWKVSGATINYYKESYLKVSFFVSSVVVQDIIKLYQTQSNSMK